MEINFKEAFTFMFKQEKFAQKYIWGCVFMLFGLLPVIACNSGGESDIIMNVIYSVLSLVVSIFTIGYGLLYANSKIAANNDILPEWTGNLGNIFKNAIKFYGGALLFLIPVGAVCAIIAFGLAVISSYISVSVLGAVGYEAMVVAALIFYILCIPVGIVFGFLLSLAYSSFLTDLKPLSFLNFRKMFSLLKGNFLNFFLIFLLYVAYVFCVGMLSTKLIIGYYIFVTIFGFYFLLVSVNLYAQYVKLGMKKELERLESVKTQE